MGIYKHGNWKNNVTTNPVCAQLLPAMTWASQAYYQMSEREASGEGAITYRQCRASTGMAMIYRKQVKTGLFQRLLGLILGQRVGEERLRSAEVRQWDGGDCPAVGVAAEHSDSLHRPGRAGLDNKLPT
jgi:hypothetical protein